VEYTEFARTVLSWSKSSFEVCLCIEIIEKSWFKIVRKLEAEDLRFQRTRKLI
jgi:hypothetical protein